MKIFKNNNLILILTLCTLLLNVACEKEKKYEVLSGQLIGYVNLFNSQFEKLSDNSGVEVIIEGSNPQLKTTTNEKGQFIVDNLNSGIYNILFNKEGYSQHKTTSFQFTGGSKPATTFETALYELPDFNIDSVKIVEYDTWSTISLQVKGYISNLKEKTHVESRCFLGNEPTVSYKNYTSIVPASTSSSSGEVSMVFQVDTIKFPIGSELYLIMYPESLLSDSYFDINTGMDIFTTINVNKASEVASITIPEIRSYW
jgi:hypothetical protein